MGFWIIMVLKRLLYPRSNSFKIHSSRRLKCPYHQNFYLLIWFHTSPNELLRKKNAIWIKCNLFKKFVKRSNLPPFWSTIRTSLPLFWNELWRRLRSTWQRLAWLTNRRSESEEDPRSSPNTRGKFGKLEIIGALLDSVKTSCVARILQCIGFLVGFCCTHITKQLV